MLALVSVTAIAMIGYAASLYMLLLAVIDRRYALAFGMACAALSALVAIVMAQPIR